MIASRTCRTSSRCKHRSHLQQGSPEYGHAFEHLVIQEFIAWLGYQGRQRELSYWRTGTGVEIDAVLGDAAVGIEKNRPQK